ncbi:MAG: hypothetical protein H0V34_06660 [Gammaproteobacteria bacterium]|nr:hypothetical protein [Gammaproteobacteria bacterium]
MTIDANDPAGSVNVFYRAHSFVAEFLALRKLAVRGRRANSGEETNDAPCSENHNASLNK